VGPSQRTHQRTTFGGRHPPLSAGPMLGSQPLACGRSWQASSPDRSVGGGVVGRVLGGDRWLTLWVLRPPPGWVVVGSVVSRACLRLFRPCSGGRVEPGPPCRQAPR
jgi:hypothetical protein